jgi:hypothetical protein
VRTHFTELGVPNVGRYNLFLQAPRATSPVGSDGLGTRGATWAFLRYALDRHPGDDRATLRALAASASTGLANVAAALGADPTAWMADWALSVYMDGLASDPSLAQPSWDFRPLLRELRADHSFPLEVLALPESGYTLRLRPGNGAYLMVGGGSGLLKVRITPSGSLSGGGLAVRVVRVE